MMSVHPSIVIWRQISSNRRASACCRSCRGPVRTRSATEWRHVALCILHDAIVHTVRPVTFGF